MPWAKFDDQFHRRRKVRRLKDPAWRLYVSAIIDCCAEQSDGWIDGDTLRELLPNHHENHVKELVAANLLHDRPGCTSEHCPAYLGEGIQPSSDDVAGAGDIFAIHDFYEWQLGREQWREMRENKVYANHVRWHIGTPNEKCIHCTNGCTPDARCNAGACGRAL